MDASTAHHYPHLPHARAAEERRRLEARNIVITELSGFLPNKNCLLARRARVCDTTHRFIPEGYKGESTHIFSCALSIFVPPARLGFTRFPFLLYHRCNTVFSYDYHLEMENIDVIVECTVRR